MKKAFNLSKILLVSLIALFLLVVTTPVLSLSSDWVINDKSKVRLISPKTTIDNMKQIVIGLEYQLEPQWKTYWKSPGGGGFPQSILWNESDNVVDIKIDWPTPKEFEILGLTSLGYEEKVIFPLNVKLKNKNKVANINLNINFLVCKHICIPGNANLFLEIKPGKGKYTEFYYEIEKSKSSLAIENINISPIEKLDISVVKNLEETEIQIIAESLKNFQNTNIFLHTPFGLPVLSPINIYSIDQKKINSSFKFKSDQFSKKIFPIEVIIFDKNHNFKFVKSILINDRFSQTNYSIFYILLISILGGFILNLMPCVFPVLSIKLLSVLNNKASNIRLSFLYTAFGIITSFLILAVFFVSLKQVGVSIAWGMQFQEPYFLIFMLFVLTIFCLNTLGLFDIQLPKFLNNNNLLNFGEGVFTKSFFNGFFATLLATPCTAPFVGSAVTIAFTQTSILFFIIFLFLGIGMSIPYILVSIIPNSISLLPKTGKWVLYVKYFLSILLAATIAWILSILNNFYNEFFIIIFIFIVFVLIISYCYSFYKFTSSIFALFVLLSIPFINFFEQKDKIRYFEDWEDFNVINIESLIKNNEILFVDVTADWCATCQFNKLNVLDKENIIKLFKDNNVKLIRADWTKPDINIDNFLKKFDKFGIPFNVFFSKKYPEGIIMSEILTEKQIKKSIENLK